jgi:hypothetical protein
MSTAHHWQKSRSHKEYSMSGKVEQEEDYIATAFEGRQP